MSILKFSVLAGLLLAACGGSDSGPPSTAFALTSIEGISYTANVTVGGSQTFDVIVDTGSTTLAVAGASCSDCNVTPAYSPGSSAMDQHSTSTSTYGDMTSWNAENFSDSVAITGDTAVTMRFAEITSQNGFFRQGFPNQGILGMGGHLTAVSGTDSYDELRMKAGLSENFAVQLCANDGTLWFGGADPAHEASAEQVTPMIPISSQQPFYAVNINSGSAGSTSIGLSGEAVVDTGTSIMVMSPDATNALISQITSAPGYQQLFGGQPLSGDPSSIDCLSSTATSDQVDAMLPPLSITLNDTNNGTFTLTASATQSYFLPVGGQYCFGVAAVSGIPITILGDTFMRAFVTTFDVENSQIRFAPQKGCDSAAIVRTRSKTGHLPWMIRGH
jgi:hypothetical protein